MRYHPGMNDGRSVAGDDGFAPGETVWFEVEDFLRYFDHFRNPTGLQRVPFEIFVEAERRYGRGGRVRFCRLSVYTGRLMPIDFKTIVEAYLDPPGRHAPWKTIWEPARLASEPFAILGLMARHPGFVLRLARTALRDAVDMVVSKRRIDTRPGDVLVSLGAPWGAPNYTARIARAKARHGLRYAFLIHDLIPIENASLVEERHVREFDQWLKSALPLADMVLTVSKYSCGALLAQAGAAGWRLPRVAALIPGTGFSERQLAGESSAEAAAMRPFPARFVLFVSTIEIRKNHRLLLRVWRRLLERHGAERVPALVFVGQIGWRVDDLLAELAASHNLSGKIVLMQGLSDAELRAAYRACLFTVFPSFCEGWGLPVAESLVHGKACAASNRTSIPEVGGDLVDYFDPSDDDDALAKVEQLLFEPGYLATREARLKAEYRPRSWTACADALVAELTKVRSTKA